jgi:hypothetical protein
MLAGKKNMLVNQLKGIFANNGVIFVAHVNALKIREEQDLRDSLSGMGLQMTHCKNTLAQQALADTKLQNLAPVFCGPVVLLHSDDQVGTTMQRIAGADLTLRARTRTPLPPSPPPPVLVTPGFRLEIHQGGNKEEE